MASCQSDSGSYVDDTIAPPSGQMSRPHCLNSQNVAGSYSIFGIECVT